MPTYTLAETAASEPQAQRERTARGAIAGVCTFGADVRAPAIDAVGLAAALERCVAAAVGECSVRHRSVARTSREPAARPAASSAARR